jgi:lipopolysaccharide biosynthesis glycosyltransferase
MLKILHSPFFCDFIQFELNDTYDTIDKACRSRLDLFDLAIQNYKKILYLDTDILIKSDLNKVFDVCTEDVMYVLEEGTIDSDTDFWGKTLFGEESKEYTDKSAFTSGILLFNHCDKIKELFRVVKEDMLTRTYETYFYDQPYIVYHAFKTGLYDNQRLKSFVVNNDENTESEQVIHHFPGIPGFYPDKLRTMTRFLTRLQYERMYPYLYQNGLVFYLK